MKSDVKFKEFNILIFLMFLFSSSISYFHYGVRVFLIVEDYCDMQNRNKSAIPLLKFMTKCNVR